MNPARDLGVLVIALALAFDAMADDPIGPAVFPVIGTPPPLNEARILGTAFLINRERGLFLTAAHVLHDCRLAAHDQPIAVRVVISVDSATEPRVIEREIPVKAVTWGYDFMARRPDRGGGTASDWAVLQLVNLADRRLLAPFAPIIIDRDQTIKSIQRELSQTGRTSIVYGYPKGNDPQHRFQVTLSDERHGRDLWLVEGRVQGGNSGGPCVWEANRTYRLIGMVLKQDPQNTRSHYILPSYAFIENVAGNLPRSAGVNTVVDFITLGRGGNDEERDERELSMFLALWRMTAIEHWQLLGAMCGVGDIDSDGLGVFMYDYYVERTTAAFIVKLLGCCPALLKLITTRSRDMVNEFNEGATGVNLNELRLALIAGEHVLDHLQSYREANVAPADLSSMLTSYVYLNERFESRNDRSRRSRQAVALAHRLDPENTDVPAAMALAFSEDLAPSMRKQLTSNLVHFTPTLFGPVIIEPKDLFIYSELWKGREAAGSIDMLRLNDEQRRSIVTAALESLRSSFGPDVM